jgi:hypothetical protein
MKIEKVMEKRKVDIVQNCYTKEWWIMTEVGSYELLDKGWLRNIRSKNRKSAVAARRYLTASLYWDIIDFCEEALKELEKAT